jgi:hypothetical protein
MCFATTLGDGMPEREVDVSKFRFSTAQRYAIFTIHGDRCYLGGEPIDMRGYHVDHVIPESLEGDARLAQVLKDLGCADDFDINSYENWLPACGPCNVAKRELEFRPSGIVQVALQRAAEKAPLVRAEAETIISDQKLGRALTIVELAHEADSIDEEGWKLLDRLVTRYRSSRAPGSDPDVVRLSSALVLPLYEVLSDNGVIRTVRGPYGVGGGPSPGSAAAASAPGCHCGSVYFNGARCVLCGSMSDD